MDSYAKVTVRVINTTDTREFITCILNNFEMPSDMTALYERLFSHYGEQLRLNNPMEMEIGWIGKRNKKFNIRTQDDMKEGLEFFLRNPNKITLFVGQKKRKTNKRLFFDTSEEETTDDEREESERTTRKRKKAPGASKQTKVIFNQLEEKHSGKFPRGHLMLWAHTLEMGHHDSFKSPPDLPLFGGGKKKIGNTNDGNVGVVAVVREAATAIANTLKPREIQVEQITPGTSNSTLRTTLIEQLKSLQELRTLGAVDEDEFLEQKQIVVDELKSLGRS